MRVSIRRLVGPALVLGLAILAGFGLGELVTGLKVGRPDESPVSTAPGTETPAEAAQAFATAQASGQFKAPVLTSPNAPSGICVHDASGQVPRADERTAQLTWTIQEVVGERTDPAATRLASITNPGSSCPIEPPLLRADVDWSRRPITIPPEFVRSGGPFTVYL